TGERRGPAGHRQPQGDGWDSRTLLRLQWQLCDQHPHITRCLRVECSARGCERAAHALNTHTTSCRRGVGVGIELVDDLQDRRIPVVETDADRLISRTVLRDIEYALSESLSDQVIGLWWNLC